VGCYNKPMLKKRNVTVEIAGWYGMTAILIAYAMVSFGLLDAGGAVFQILNLTGALGIITISAYKNVKQSVVLNIFWAGVAVVALFKLFF
jgi:hypothetical protein